MQPRSLDVWGRRVWGRRTERKSGPRRRHSICAALFAGIAIATCLMVHPAKADFVCNTKTKLVNVFLQPPSYWPTTIPQNETAFEMIDRLAEEERRKARGPNVQSPVDVITEPFDLVDTLPQGSRVKALEPSEKESRWVQIMFRHSKTGMLSRGFVHLTRLSKAACPAGAIVQDEAYYTLEPDEPQVKDLTKSGTRKFSRHADGDATPSAAATKCGLSHAEIAMIAKLQGKAPALDPDIAACIKSVEDAKPSATGAKCGSVPDADTVMLKVLQGEAPDLDPHIVACAKSLEADANDIDALIARGDVYHRYAESYQATSKPYPELAKAAQAKAIADWKHAADIEAKARGLNPLKGAAIADPLPSKLGRRLAPSGSAGEKAK